MKRRIDESAIDPASAISCYCANHEGLRWSAGNDLRQYGPASSMVVGRSLVKITTSVLLNFEAMSGGRCCSQVLSPMREVSSEFCFRREEATTPPSSIY